MKVKNKLILSYFWLLVGTKYRNTVIFTNFLKDIWQFNLPKNHFIFAISFMNFLFWQNFASEEKVVIKLQICQM
jgi:hypothetical protein